MELKRRFVPSRLFWATYPGIAVLGIGGSLAFASLGTAMLLFRPFFEPWAGFAIGLAASLLLHHARGLSLDGPENYLWLIGWVYAMGVVCLAASVYAAYAKPASDRKVDAYLQRKLAIDSSHVSYRDPHSGRN